MTKPEPLGRAAFCLKAAMAVLLAAMPSRIKVWLYRRFFGYQIGRDVRIGFTVFLQVARCRIGDGVRIGHCNAFYRVGELDIQSGAHVGVLNLFRGGDRISIGQYASVLRMNVFNSIPEPEVVNPTEPVLEIGDGAVVTSSHWLDFTDRIRIGDHTIVGGRNSSLWTHNRQRTKPIEIGDHCYLGSEIRVAPGVEVAPFCIVALGAVLMDRYTQSRWLIAGNPAKPLRALRDHDLFLVARKTRNDIPDECVRTSLPEEIHAAFIRGGQGPPITEGEEPR